MGKMRFQLAVKGYTEGKVTCGSAAKSQVRLDKKFCARLGRLYKIR